MTVLGKCKVKFRIWIGDGLTEVGKGKGGNNKVKDRKRVGNVS